jgi:hypothetical protein
MRFKSEPLYIVIPGIFMFSFILLLLIISLFFVVKIVYGFIVLLIIILIVIPLRNNIIKYVELNDDGININYLLKQSIFIEYEKITKVILNKEGFYPYYVYVFRFKPPYKKKGLQFIVRISKKKRSLLLL